MSANVYDYQAVRSAAQKTKAVADTVNRYRTSELARISNTGSKLKGETAKALDSVSDDVATELARIYKGFSSCADKLFEYAAELQRADELARQAAQSK